MILIHQNKNWKLILFHSSLYKDWSLYIWDPHEKKTGYDYVWGDDALDIQRRMMLVGENFGVKLNQWHRIETHEELHQFLDEDPYVEVTYNELIEGYKVEIP